MNKKEADIEFQKSFTPEEFVEQLDKDYGHNFLDDWFSNGLAGWRASYSLTHPWKVFEYFWKEFCFALERVFIGYDKRVIWSIDYYLAKMLPIWLEKLKYDKHGIPTVFLKKEDEYTDANGILCIKDEAMIRGEKEFDDILDKIINGFKAYKRIEDEVIYPEKNGELYYQLNNQFEEGFDLLKKYFGTLWD